MDYSALRKELQAKGEAPSWFTTAGIQLFYEKYSFNNETPKARYQSIAKAMAQHAPKNYPTWWNEDEYTKGLDWEQAFFNGMWDGFISPSTPLLANGGLRKRGTTVSCANGYAGDNLFDRYNTITEAAILTKHAHGTSYCIDDWPSEGTPLKRGGFSMGVMPFIRDMINTMNEVTQASRRGSLAYYLGMDHGDFDAVADYLYSYPESNNVGWLVKDDFIAKLKEGDKESVRRFNRALDVKMPRGKGYFTFIDKMNRHLAAPMRDKGLKSHSSNLCSELLLISDNDYTASCVILNYNLELYDTWPEHIIQIGQVMSDCNISEYVETLHQLSEQDQVALRKIIRFTEEFRALGSGVLGWHTLLQRKRIPVASMDAMLLNNEVFKRLHDDSKEATQWLAQELGEPIGCKGYGVRNATMNMLPPTKSTAEIMAGASEGIGYDTAMVFTKQSAGGEFFRINKVLLEIMKERGVYTEEEVMNIAKAKGSVQKVSWLTPEEKMVFLTAFEIPQEWVINLAAQRQPYIDQQQSINLYFTSNDSEEYIGKIHRMAFENENILSLYYIYSMRGAGDITRVESCEMCQ